MSMILREALAYDDVLLTPQYSEIESRSQINLEVDLGPVRYSHPIIPANMKTVTGLEMADAIARSGGLSIMHRFMSLQDQIYICSKMISNFGYTSIAASVGIKKEDLENVNIFLHNGVKLFCIDIAHGDSKYCVDMIKNIKSFEPTAFIIAGNVATGTGAIRLWEAGADVVKVGVGPGSLCTTRVETGNGVPQLSALMDVSHALKTNAKNLQGKKIIADGGIKSAGDIVKALCFADMVMIGNLFAGTDESPGEIIDINGRSYKSYVGSSTHKTNHVEGVSAMVPYKGPVEHILTKLLEGLRSGCSYQGVSNLYELKDNPVFIKITNAGLRESHPHDVVL